MLFIQYVFDRKSIYLIISFVVVNNESILEFYISTNRQTDIHTYIHTYMHTYIHAHIHTCIHTYIYADIYTIKLQVRVISRV